MLPVNYIFASTHSHFENAKQLFIEYASSLPIALDFQHFEDELNVVDTMYAPPNGALLLATLNDITIACAGIRKIADGVCELKRMYVRPKYRKEKIGKRLLADLIAHAQSLGYRYMRLDTLEEMVAARKLYTDNGFYEIDAYYHNPNNNIVYLERKLPLHDNRVK